MKYGLKPEKFKEVYQAYTTLKTVTPEFIREIRSSGGDGYEWVGTEKIRGKCVSVLCNPDGDLAIGGRYAFADENFYNCAGDVVSVHFDKLKEYCKKENITIQVYGILFGGFFTFKPENKTTMDEMVMYSSNYHWWIHDVLVNGTLVGWKRVVEIARELKIRTVPVIKHGKLNDVISVTPEKRLSIVSLILHETTIKNNYMGGIVYRPLINTNTYKEERMIFKFVRDIFSNLSNSYTSKPDLKETDTMKYDEVLLSFLLKNYVTQNRINLVIGRKGKPIHERELGSYLQVLCKELFEDAKKDGLEKPVIKKIANALTLLFKSNFYEILGTIYIAEKNLYMEKSRTALDKYKKELENAEKIKVINGNEFVSLDGDTTKTTDSDNKTKPTTSTTSSTNKTSTTSSTTSTTSSTNKTSTTTSTNKTTSPSNTNSYGGYNGYNNYSYSSKPDTTINFIACSDVDEADLLVPAYKEKRSPGFGFFSIEQSIINPGQTKFVRTGWRCNIESGYSMHMEPRSSFDVLEDVHVLTKPNIITESFTDELKIVVWNNGTKPIEIPKNTMMVYGIISKSEPVKIDVIKEETQKISVL